MAWLRATDGNSGFMFAIMAVPFFGVVALAVDYGLALADKSKLDGAADAAALAAVKTANDLINNKGVDRTTAMMAGSAQAAKTFRANAGSVAFGQVPVPTSTWMAGQSGQTLSNTVTYSMVMNNTFNKLIGIPTTPISGKSSATTVMSVYYQFIFVVDVSGSMSVGASQSDIAGMKQDNRIQCAFACHDPYHKRGPNDYRAFAKADGWKLKIDYVNSAIQNFIQDLQTQTASVSGTYSVGIQTFATTFNILQNPTPDLNAALNTAKTIDIEPMMDLSQSQGYTRISTSLNAALAAVTNIGDGSNVNKQKTFFIFLSDGLEDIEGNGSYGRGTDVAYTNACNDIKRAGATMIAINATYPSFPADPQYNEFVKPYESQLVPTMQSCASGPSWYFQASDGPGINNAVSTILQQVIQGVTRLTQ